MSKGTIILGIILAVSLYGNYTLYQDTHTLKQDIRDLDGQVKSFQKQADEIQQKLGAITSAKESLEKMQS
ncbi:MAG TPA: hypothetical protein VIG05_07975, partial [Candidatus Nitrosotenuis sp.]